MKMKEKGCVCVCIFAICLFVRFIFHLKLFALATMCNTSIMAEVEHGQHLILLHYETMHCNSHFTRSMTNTLFHFFSSPSSFPSSDVIGGIKQCGVEYSEVEWSEVEC